MQATSIPDPSPPRRLRCFANAPNHDYDMARRIDAATAAAIERAEWESLGPDQACGFLAIAGLLAETSRRRLAPQRLALCNSGDTAGGRDRVVGYGAWMVEERAAAA